MAFEGLGGGIGHVLVGCIVTEVISSAEVLSRCDCSSSIMVLDCSRNSIELPVKCLGV